MKFKMSFFVILLSFSCSLHAIDLASGHYELIKSDEPLCPHEVRVHRDPDWGTVSLEVVYVGDCYYMGPYTYYCQKNTCSNGAIEFEVTGKNQYHWKNRNYGFQGDFALKQ